MKKMRLIGFGALVALTALAAFSGIAVLGLHLTPYWP